MLITPSNMDALFIAFNKQFQDAMMATPSVYEKIASTVPSNTRDQRYPFVQALSTAMRLWTGPRQIQNLVVDGIVVTNNKYESTVQLERTDIEDDQYQIWSQMVMPLLGKNAKRNPDIQIAALIESASGAGPTGYDGVSFWNASHPYDPSDPASSTQSNVFTSHALSATTLATVRAAMMNFKDPAGYTLGIVPDTLMVPPSLQYVAETLANAAFYPEIKNANSSVFGAQSNTFKGAFNVVVNPYLTDTGSTTTAVWYLLDTSSVGIRPFFWQQRVAPELVQMVDPSNPVVFDLDVFRYGARARGAAACSLWFLGTRAHG